MTFLGRALPSHRQLELFCEAAWSLACPALQGQTVGRVRVAAFGEDAAPARAPRARCSPPVLPWALSL